MKPILFLLSGILFSSAQASEIACALYNGYAGEPIRKFVLNSGDVKQKAGEPVRYARFTTKIGEERHGNRYIVSVGLMEAPPVKNPDSPWSAEPIYRRKRFVVSFALYENRKEVDPEFANYQLGRANAMVPSGPKQAFFLSLVPFKDEGFGGVRSMDSILLSCASLK